MDALHLVLLLLLSVAIFALPLDDLNAVDVSTAPSASEKLENTENKAVNVTQGKNCSTARDLSGTCVERSACDYSTPAIDLSLYAPHGYKSACTSDEVCCPFNYLVPENPKYENNQNINGNEDEDDNDDDFWDK